MIFSHLPESDLLIKLKNYRILLNNNCQNKENIINFYNDCKRELENRKLK